MTKHHTTEAMPRIKIAITMDEEMVTRLDRLVGAGQFANRSRAIETAVRERLDILERTRLESECEKLDATAEKLEAEMGFSADSTDWPDY